MFQNTNKMMKKYKWIYKENLYYTDENYTTMIQIKKCPTTINENCATQIENYKILTKVVEFKEKPHNTNKKLCIFIWTNKHLYNANE